MKLLAEGHTTSLWQSQKFRHEFHYQTSHQSPWGKGEVQMQKEWLDTQLSAKVSEHWMLHVSYYHGKSPPQNISVKKCHLLLEYKSLWLFSALNYLKQQKYVGSQWIYIFIVKSRIHPMVTFASFKVLSRANKNMSEIITIGYWAAFFTCL